MKYSDKLKDPRWQKKRLEIFERDNWTCIFCGEEEKTLSVHHLYYDKGNPWEVRNAALVTVCEGCHKKESEFNINRSMNTMSVQDLSFHVLQMYIRASSEDLTDLLLNLLKADIEYPEDEFSETYSDRIRSMANSFDNLIQKHLKEIQQNGQNKNH